MAWREGRKRGGGDLDLSPEDRTGAPPGDSSAAPGEPSEKPNKKPAKRGAPRRRNADAAPRKRKRTRRTRSMLGRAAYWGAVLALWLVAIVLVMLVLFGRYLSTDLEDAAT